MVLANTESIRIWQQNTRKSLTAQLATLHSVRDEYDIICIQEPHMDFQAMSRATSVWTAVYPSSFKHDKDGPPARALTLVRTRISTNNWTQTPIDSLDVVAICLTSARGTLHVYNIYNNCTHSDTIYTLSRHLQARSRRNRQRTGEDAEGGDIWLGDFNRHNPWWEDAKNSRLFTQRNLDDAQVLIDLLAEFNMDMALPPFTPTITNSRGSQTRPDNVFITRDIANWVTMCEVRPDDTPPMADHFPIVTQVDFPVPRPNKNRPWNFRVTDWERFRRVLAEKLKGNPSTEQLNSAEDIDKKLEELEKAVLDTMEATVPKSCPSSYAKRWWNKDLERARREVRRAAASAKTYKQFPLHSSHAEVRRARNIYSELINKSKQGHWESWLEGITSKNVWDLHRFTSTPATDGSKTRIPAFRTTDVRGQPCETLDNKGKSALLHEVFFYPPPADHGIDPNQEYPEATIYFEEVTDDQIARKAQKLNAFKAPGINGISNSVLTHCADLLAPHLGPIFRATFNANYYPAKWKTYKTVVLRKPGKPDYSVPNAYRPIALLDVFAKLLSACVKDIWEHHVEAQGLLPASQFGGRKGRTATDAVHSLVEFTKQAWRRKKEVVLLFLDIKGAFPNVSIPVLTHDMRNMGFHPRYTRWITNKTTDRHTVLTFDDFVSPPFEVKHGLDQGCNLSPFLYNCYSAGQMRAVGRGKEEIGNTYADDGVCGAWGETLEDAGRKVEEMFNREGGPKDWGRSHHSIYELHKSGALAMTRKRMVDPNNPRKRIKHPPITIKLDEGNRVTTSSTQKYLGVIIDSELRFKEQTASAIGKGSKWANQSGRLVKVAKGIKGALARRMYYGAAVASMLYAVDVWGAPPIKSRGEGLRIGTVSKLESTQRRAALQATGGLRTTPTDLLFAHADMMPVRQLIEGQCNRAATRLASLHPSHPLYKTTHKAAKSYPKRHPSPLNNILHTSKIKPNSLETIDPRPRHPHWKPPFTTSIPTSKEDACQAELDDEADIKIYTDGSGKEGHIGAAAVLYHGFRVPRTARFHVGSSNEHTVFEGESIGQLLGLKLLQNTYRNLNGVEVSLCVDSQAAIKRHNSWAKSPADYIFEEIHKLAREIMSAYPNVKLKIRWTPGHMRIQGNETVDTEAKKAADNPEANVNARFGILARGLPVSRSAHRQKLKDAAKAKYVRSFRDGPRFHRMVAFDPSMPSRKFLNSIAKLPRRFVSILTQLRTNHVPLQAYLHRFKRADSPTCQQCFSAPETVSHYLFFCNKYATQRLHLTKAFDKGRALDRSVLGNRKLFPALFRFIKDSNRFEDTFGDLNPETQR